MIDHVRSRRALRGPVPLFASLLVAACHRGHPSVPSPEALPAAAATTAPVGDGGGDWRRAAESDRIARETVTPRAATAPVPAPSPADTARPRAPVAVAPTPETAPAAPPSSIVRAERWEEISPEAVNADPGLPVAGTGGPTVLRVQVLLDRAGFSPGAIDGYWGDNTRKAVYWLQESSGLESTGEVDAATYRLLDERFGRSEPVVRHALTAKELEGPFVDLPESVYERQRLDCQCYTSPLEMLAEQSHTTPAVLQRLNPEVRWSALTPGTRVWLPDTRRAAIRKRIARIVVSKQGSYVQALDDGGNIVGHVPSTLGSKYDPSPTGHFEVTRVVHDPDFHYNPKLYADVPDHRPDARLKPGPNSPVGVVWMALNAPHYGIHGTPEPETIGKTSSHGCVRLTNWDARWLAAAVKKGTTVEFR